MTGPEVLDVARDAIFTLVLVASPLMLVGLVVGVVISLFQALTQIQEMTLVFVPKILAIFIALLIALPFMADQLHARDAAARRPHRQRLNAYMQIDVSFLPALAAAFLLMFARIGTMVMLLPGLGEMSVPARVRLTVALVLTAVLLPPHRKAYAVDLSALGPVLLMLVQEMLIGAVLGLTARLTISALQVAGSVVAQQLGLGFVTAVDPTQGQQGMLVGNFLTMLGVTLIFATDLHHLVIAALNDSYTLFQPGEMPLVGDVAQHVTRTVADRVPHRHPAFGAVPGVRPAVQSRARRAVAADAADAGVLRRPAAVDPARLPDPAAGARRHDGDLPRLSSKACCSARAARLSGDRWPTNSDDHRTNRRPDTEAPRRGAQARRRGQEPGGQHLVRHRRRDAGADGVLRRHERRT